MYFTSTRLLLCLCVLLGAVWACPARADIALAAKKITLSAGSLQDVQAHVAPGSDPDTVRISLRVGKADLAALGWHHVGIKLDGSLRRDAQLRWVFDGNMQMLGAPGGALTNTLLNVVVDASANTLEIDANQDAIKIATAIPLDQPTHAQVSLKHLPAAWLQGLLSSVYAGRSSGGELDADLALDTRDSGIQASGDFNVNNLGFELSGRNVAAQALGAHGRFSVDATGRPVQIQVNGSMRAGQFQLGGMLMKLPAHDVQLDIEADVLHGAIALSRMHIDDADALQLDGSVAFDAKGNLQKLKLDRIAARFPAAYERYGDVWLDTLGLKDMRIVGQVDGHMEYAVGGLRSFAFHSDGLDAFDAAGHFSVSQLRGGVDWSLTGERPVTAVEWNHLTVYRIPYGSAVSHWHSHDGDLILQSPFADSLLHGHMDVNAVDWRPAASKDQRLALSVALAGVDMAELGRTIGWPQLAGTLNGAIPSFHWSDNRIALDGGLSISTFGGAVDITRMTLQQPFGTEPVLSGDVALRDLDLASLSSAFNFGSISGRLNGSIDALQLVDWSPVSFKASLRADRGGHISQRAVNNLGAITGGGIGGGLQGAMLRLFKNASYKRLGLDCTLQNNVCQMGGVVSGGDGYTVIEGSGLPNVTVTSRQAQIEWPVLIRRLKAATQSAEPETR